MFCLDQHNKKWAEAKAHKGSCGHVALSWYSGLSVKDIIKAHIEIPEAIDDVNDKGIYATNCYVYEIILKKLGYKFEPPDYRYHRFKSKCGTKKQIEFLCNRVKTGQLRISSEIKLKELDLKDCGKSLIRVAQEPNWELCEIAHLIYCNGNQFFEVPIYNDYYVTDVFVGETKWANSR